MTTHRPRGLAAAAALAALAFGAAACGGARTETAPIPEPEPAAVAAAPAADRASVCAPGGYLTENIVTRFGDVFTATDSLSVRRRRGMKVARLRSAPAAAVGDEAVCARVVRALAGREPAAAAALGPAPGRAPARGAKGRPAPRPRPVKPAQGGVLAIVKVGPYFLVQDAARRPNEARSAATYVLDASMRLKGVFQ